MKHWLHPRKFKYTPLNDLKNFSDGHWNPKPNEVKERFYFNLRNRWELNCEDMQLWRQNESWSDIELCAVFKMLILKTVHKVIVILRKSYGNYREAAFKLYSERNQKKKSSDITQKTALLMLVRNPLENSFQMWIEKTW